MKPRPRALLVAACALLAGLVAAAFAACLPAYTFGESSDGGADATTDATSDGAPAVDGPSGSDGSGNPEASTSSDAGPDAHPPVDGGPPLDAQATIAVVNVGSNAYPVGYGYQSHLIYAQNDGRYWLFYAVGTGASQISTLVSPDLVTWAPGASIAVTSGYTLADGYSFSVTYANLGGNDVVHIVENSASGSDDESFHIRATIASGAITGSAPVGLPDTNSSGAQGSSAGSCLNDGPATTIGADGHVWDVTAWTGHQGATTCDTNIYESPGVDTGASASWNTGAFVHDGYYVSLPSYAWSHELLTLPDAGVVMIVYPDEDNTSTTLFDSIGWALSPSFDGGGPGSTGVDMPAADELFNGTGNQASLNDWASCRLTDGNVHVMRHVITTPGNASDTSVGPFEEVVYNGTSWAGTSPPPSVTSTTNTGLVLLSDANPDDGILAAVIGTDNAIHIAKWTSGSAGWIQLSSIPGSTARISLAGTGCGSRRPAIFWTEGSASPYQIMAADLSGLL